MTETPTPAPAGTDEQVAVDLRTGARRLGLGQNALFSALKQGNGPRTFRLGRRHLVTIEALREWARKLEAKPHGGADNGRAA